MTAEQRIALERLRALAGPRQWRVKADVEGWPISPGRRGQIEHDGERLAVYTDRRRLHAQLLAITGVHRHQRGDTELRAWVEEPALLAVAQVIRAKKRRSSAAAAHLAAHAYRVTSGAESPAGSP